MNLDELVLADLAFGGSGPGSGSDSGSGSGARASRVFRNYSACSASQARIILVMASGLSWCGQ